MHESSSYPSGVEKLVTRDKSKFSHGKSPHGIPEQSNTFIIDILIIAVMIVPNLFSKDANEYSPIRKFKE